MSFNASHKYARISPRKVRLIADMVRGKFVDEALDILRYQPQRGARLIEKVIESARGNALDPDQQKGKTVNAAMLVIEQAHVDGGPIMKRIQPRARGMAFQIKKRTAHIRVAVDRLDNS